MVFNYISSIMVTSIINIMNCSKQLSDYLESVGKLVFGCLRLAEQ